MNAALPASLGQKAFALAKNLALAPESRIRSNRTETMWTYHPYEGGMPTIQIDWRQSAKGRDILIREHEPISRRNTYFWTDLAQDTALHDEVSVLLLGLAYLLVGKDRSVGWLADGLPKTQTASQVVPLLGTYLAAPPCEQAQPLHNAFILIASDLNNDTTKTGHIVQTCAAQRNRGLLLHCGDEPLSSDNPVVKQCNTLEWPVLTLHRNERLEVCLVHLFEKSILATR